MLSTCRQHDIYDNYQSLTVTPAPNQLPMVLPSRPVATNGRRRLEDRADSQLPPQERSSIKRHCSLPSLPSSDFSPLPCPQCRQLAKGKSVSVAAIGSIEVDDRKLTTSSPNQQPSLGLRRALFPRLVAEASTALGKIGSATQVVPLATSHVSAS